MVTCTKLNGFDDPSLAGSTWQDLLHRGSGSFVFTTREWLSAWWKAFGRGNLLLICAAREGKVVAVAPLFSENGMIYFVGSGGSDYLDFVGDASDPEVIDSILSEARRHVAEFIGFVFYHVPDSSGTSRALLESGERLGLEVFDEGGMPAPAIEIPNQDFLLAATTRKSLVRHERYFSRGGEFKVEHMTRADEILPHLEDFFSQHRSRWAQTPFPSLFCDASQERFYRLLTEVGSDAGWLRFTRIEWRGIPIAFHFGFSYLGTFMWYKPSFAIDLARHSPGEVLLRQLLLAAAKESAHTFDFGLGDEKFKSRFATRVNHVRNWGLYDPAALERKTQVSA